MSAKVYLALIHNPVYNKNMEVITTTITNFDLHDIARSSRTYNIENYYIVNHLKSQQEMVSRMKEYWMSQFGADYNADRKEAFSIIEVKSELDDVLADIEKKEGVEPKIITTDARTYDGSISFEAMRDKFAAGGTYLILLGTGWGMVKELMVDSNYILKPIAGPGDYNHLSVRSAAAIILDRLLGDRN